MGWKDVEVYSRHHMEGWGNDIISSMAGRCVVKGLNCALMIRRLRWLGHVQKKNKEEALDRRLRDCHKMS